MSPISSGGGRKLSRPGKFIILAVIVGTGSHRPTNRSFTRLDPNTRDPKGSCSSEG
jgi:hypothetical protein